MSESSTHLEQVLWLPTLAPRPPDSHKGDFGRVLVVAGSRGMAGAAILCGSTVLRGGAGLVRLAVPEAILPTVAAGHPCYMATPLPQDRQGRLSLRAGAMLTTLAQANDIVAFGPGLSATPSIAAVLRRLLKEYPGPLVLDADGLNALVGHTSDLRGRPTPAILTPHPGEFARLIDRDIATVQAQRQELAVAFARHHEVVVVLKGAGTLVTDGRRLYENTTGNPGMATGGSGDVLTGLIAALLGQRLSPFDAAQLGVHLHGLAGDLACEQLGEVSLTAADLLDYLPAAFRHHSQAGS
jgi:NAD(P)H-hydrate epimerase